MLFAGIALLLGSSLVFYFTGPVDVFWVSFLPITLLWMIISPVWRLFSIFLAAVLWTSLIISFQLDHILPELNNNEVLLVQGQIIDIPLQNDSRQRFTFRPDPIKDLDGITLKKIRVSWYHSSRQLHSGERWQLKLKLKRPHGFQNPAGFDYERWLFVNNIGAIAYVRKSDLNKKLDSAPAYDLASIRETIKNKINRSCADCNTVGLIQALSVGFKGNINPQQFSLLQDTGTAHLLAISGLHVGMVCALFYLIGRRFWLILPVLQHVNRQLIATGMGLLAALVYSALAGFSLTTVRALLMLSLVFVAMLLRFRINLLHSISVAIIIILMVDPLSVGSSSFWLTFCALLIIACGQMLMKYQQQRWRQLVLIQVLFSVLFIPLSIVIFDQINPASFAANLIAIPVVSLLVVPLSLIGSLLAMLNADISSWFLLSADFVLSGLIQYLQFLLDLGFDVVKLGNRPLWILLLAAPALLILFLPVWLPYKKPTILILLCVIFFPHQRISQGSVKTTVLDVGMGTSVLVQTRLHSLVYDFGDGNPQGFSTARWVLLPYLQHEGITDVNMLVFSHADQDHSGGFYGLEDQFSDTPLLSGEPERIKKKFKLQRPVFSCHHYPAWHWDGVLFEFLSTDSSDQKSSSNNRSCVLQISGRHHRFLLTGDIEKSRESELLVKYSDTVSSKLQADFMLVPHHGSKTSSSKEFIKAVEPSLAIFTVGYGNRWGFPKKEVVQRYHDQQISTLRTDNHGAISIISDSKKASIITYRQHRSYFSPNPFMEITK